jgi:hypothetical protein
MNFNVRLINDTHHNFWQDSGGKTKTSFIKIVIVALTTSKNQWSNLCVRKHETMPMLMFEKFFEKFTTFKQFV